jgi:hypothetical protein
VTVGEALAEARAVAGLTVDEVSERTKIREVVIRGIERDEYEACGGDLFVRGYVRVIADAVGIDAQPLIHEYDQSHKRDAAPAVGTAPTDAASTVTQPAADPEAEAGPASETGPAPAPEIQAEADPVNAEPAPARDSTPPSDSTPAPDPAPEPLSAQSAAPVDEPAPTVVDLTQAATPGKEPPADHLAAAAVPQPGYELVPLRIQPGPRLHPSLTRRTWRRWLRDQRRSVAAAVSAVVVLAGAAIAGTLVASSAGSASSAGTRAAASSGATHQAPPPRAAAGADSVGASARKPAAKAAPHAKRKATVRRVPVRQLAVSFAEAFGPDGPGDGDNPDNAMNAVRPGGAQPWNTQWYQSARFGALKSGTGLLLDMGRAVTVTRVAIDLGAGAGADLQLRAGNAVGDLRAVTSAADAGGDVVLHLSKPARARYLLVWFTLLPQAAGAQYQASVYHVTVAGRP